jgi:hypothetical protein
VRDGDPVISFYRWISVFPAPFVEEAVFSPMHVVGSFVENQVAVAALVCFWVFYSFPLVSISIFVSIPCCFNYYGSKNQQPNELIGK